MIENASQSTLHPVKVSLAYESRDGVLASREDGVKARTRIEKEIANQPPGTPIEFDFTGVVAVTVTFVDESFGRLLSSRLAGFDEDHAFFVTGASEAVRDTLSAALRNRRLQLLSFSDGVELLGGDELLEETIREALHLESFRVSDLAGRLGLTVQAANNRLAHLVRVGALSRERVVPSRGGREFRYVTPPIPRSHPTPAARGATRVQPR